MLRNFIRKLIEPQSTNDDLRRRELILNILLLGSVALAGAALVIRTMTILFGEKLHSGISVWVLFAIFIFLLGIYKLSRIGFVNTVSYFLILTLLIPTGYIAFIWSPILPQSLLMFALVIVMSGIVINKKTSLLITISVAIFTLSLSCMRSVSLYHPDIAWMQKGYDSSDVIVAVITLFLITIISWLSNREIERSLDRAHKSEADLKKERDSLEVRVIERTKQLEAAQEEKITQLYRFTEFGRVSSGIFHDLMNPLTALSLNLQEIQATDDKEVGKIKEYLDDACQANIRMQDYISSIRQQFSQKEIKKKFDLKKAIEQVNHMLALKALDGGVKIIFDNKDVIEYFGDPVKFQRIMTNLIANAIDAYENIEASEDVPKKVLVGLNKSGGAANITIQDWGSGIDKKSIEHIFDPFFTTKGGEKGMGLGLSMVKDTLSNDFKGIVEVASKQGKGTTFTVKFPLKHSKNKATLIKK